MRSDQGVIVLLPTTISSSARDFTEYDAYIDNLGLVFFEDDSGPSAAFHEFRHETDARPLSPVRQDVGQNPYETRPESGDIFAQGDFSKGQDQQYFHRVNRDVAKYLYSDGFDISVPGKLKHSADIDIAAGITAPLALTQTQDMLFVTDGTNVKNTTDLTTFASENPNAAEGVQTVLDIEASGDEIYAALGTNGVHKRSSGGTWAHFQPDGATDLSGVGTVTLVRWLRSRLFIAGDSGRGAYEVVADSTPTVMTTLPVGWSYTDFFESGKYVYGCAINRAAGKSQIDIFGLNSAGSAFEIKGSSPLPVNQLAYTGRGFLGQIYLGMGKKNSSGGLDPVVYQGLSDADGFVFLQAKVAEGTGAGSIDLPVRALEPVGEALVCGWAESTGAPFGAREGLAHIYPARAAFAITLALETAPGTVETIRDVLVYKGRTCYVTTDQLLYEDTAQYRSTATMVTSIGDWNNAGGKTWSLFELLTRPLPVGSSIDCYYTTGHPEDNDWHLIGTSATPLAESASFLLTNVNSAKMAIKLVSHADQLTTSAPEIISFSLRSDPKPQTPEWTLARSFVIASSLRKNDFAARQFYTDPNATLASIRGLLYTWVTYYDQEQSWRVFVSGMRVVRIGTPQYQQTSGESIRNVFIASLVMVGTEVTSTSGGIRAA